MTKHTEGPWVVAEDSGTAVVTLANVGPRETVITFLPQAHHANARLLAAAPVLLAALQRVGCQDKSSCGADEVDGLCFVCRAIETAVWS